MDIDRSILFYIQNSLHNQIFDLPMIVMSFIGKLGMIWVLISLILIVSKKYRAVGLLTLASIILSAIIGTVILKEVFQRSRPFIDFPEINILIKRPITYSFPSGHTMTSFAASGVLVRYFRKYSIAILTIASLISYSRLYLFLHYPSDILAGIVLGLFCSFIVNKFYKYKYYLNLDY